MVQGRERYICTFTWAADKVGKTDYVTEKLPKNTFIKNIHLYLFGGLTTTVTAPTRHEDSPMSLIRLISLKGAGSGFFDVSFARWFYRLYYFYGLALERLNIGVTASTQYDLYAHGIIPFGITKYAGGVLPPVFDDLAIGIQWGTFSDLYTANAPTAWDSGKTPTVQVYVEEDDVGPAPNTVPLIKTWEKEEDVTSAGDKDLDFPKGNVILDAMMYVLDNSVRSDALCTKFSVKSRNPNEDFAEAFEWMKWQAKDKQRYGIENPLLEADGSTNNRRTVKGFAMVDFTSIGGLAMVVGGKAREAVSFKGTFGSPTGTARIGMLVRELLPARG